MKQLIDQFVCVRLVKANDLNLSLFQFDFDLTFAVFFMNADNTIYGRYGTRSSRDDADREMTAAGLARSMAAALELHKRYPDNKRYLSGKQPVSMQYKSPDDFPSLRGKYKQSLDYDGAVTRSCLHCHQILDAQRHVYRKAGKPIPEKLLFPHPSPRVVGFALDPTTRATIASVTPESPAAQAGLKAGDRLYTLDGQATLSLADVQWALHQTAGDKLPAVVRRGDDILELQINLPQQWRRQSDISWRVSSWPLRRMGTGGLVLTPASREQRQQAKVTEDQLALLVSRVGQYGPHAAAKRAGFKQGDIIVSFNGKTDAMTDSQLLAYVVQNTRPGQRIPVVVVRDGQRRELRLPMQE